MHRRLFVSRPAAATSRPADRPEGPAVLTAPWVGPNDEIVLIALDAHRRLLGEPMVVPNGADHVAASDKMWDRVLGAERRVKLI